MAVGIECVTNRTRSSASPIEARSSRTASTRARALAATKPSADQNGSSLSILSRVPSAALTRSSQYWRQLEYDW